MCIYFSSFCAFLEGGMGREGWEKLHLVLLVLVCRRLIVLLGRFLVVVCRRLVVSVLQFVVLQVVLVPWTLWFFIS